MTEEELKKELESVRVESCSRIIGEALQKYKCSLGVKQNGEQYEIIIQHVGFKSNDEIQYSEG